MKEFSTFGNNLRDDIIEKRICNETGYYIDWQYVDEEQTSIQFILKSKHGDILSISSSFTIDPSGIKVLKTVSLEKVREDSKDKHKLYFQFVNPLNNFYCDITEIYDLISAEESRATTAEEALQTSLDNEVTRAIKAETALSSELTSEIARIDTNVTTLNTDLTTERTERLDAFNRAMEAIVALTQETAIIQNDLNTEITRAKGTESTLQSNIDTESEVRELADNTLQATIISEGSRAKTAEETLQKQINTNIEAISNINDHIDTVSSTIQVSNNYLDAVSGNTIIRTYLNGQGKYQELVNNIYDSTKDSTYQKRINFDGTENTVYIDTHLGNKSSIYTAVTGEGAYISTNILGDNNYIFTQLNGNKATIDTILEGYARPKIYVKGDETTKTLQYTYLSTYTDTEETCPLLFIQNNGEITSGFAYDTNSKGIGYVTKIADQLTFTPFNYIPKSTTTGNYVYSHENDVQSEVEYSVLCTNSSLVQRNAEGSVSTKAVQFKNGTWLDVQESNGPLVYLRETQETDSNYALTTKSYVDTQIAKIDQFKYVVSTDASTTPLGIVWYDGETKVEGTLVASASTEYIIYLVPCKHTATETQKGYDEYLTVKNESTYSWEVLGNTADIDLSEIADANIKTSQISSSRLFNNSLEGVINTGGSNYATIDGPKAEIANWSILNATFGDDADFESAEVTINDPTTKKNPVSLGYLETNYTTKTYVDGEVDTLVEEITNEIDRAIEKENELSSSIDTLNKDLLQEIEDRENADSELKTRVSTIESSYIKKDGSVSMTGNLNLNSNKITNLKDPESDTDAVNKQFLNTSITTAQSSLESKINTEISNRQTEDSNLQSQIDAITSGSDVVDVVATNADLNSYDKSKLTDKDIIKVLKDESQSDKTTYYRFDKSTSSFTLIGGVGPYYTQSEVDTKINQKQNTITSENKLAANLISGLSTVATTGSYNDLSDKPSESVVNNGKLTIQKNGTTIQTFTANQSTDATVNVEVPTKTSELTNDSNYVTTTDLANKQDKITTTNKLSSSLVDGLSKVATSGSYNDLSNTPTIPTVNNGTLTIQKNGTTVQTFTANQSTNVNADITVPTKVSELSNDSGYTTNTGTVTSVAVKLNDAVKGTVTTSGTIDLGSDILTTDNIKSNIINLIYPVGSIYMSINNVSPASFLGGTWEALKDRFLIGAGNIYSVNDLGGSTTSSYTLTSSNMPAHSHSYTVSGSTDIKSIKTPSQDISFSTNFTAPDLCLSQYQGESENHICTYVRKNGSLVSGSYQGYYWIEGAEVYEGTKSNMHLLQVASHSHKCDITIPQSSDISVGNQSFSVDGSTESYGSASPTAISISTMSPYLAVYMWKRTA